MASNVIVLKTPPPRPEVMLEVARAASRRLQRALEATAQFQSDAHSHGKECWIDKLKLDKD